MPAELPFFASERKGIEPTLSCTGTWTPRTFTGTSLLQTLIGVLGAKSLELIRPFCTVAPSQSLSCAKAAPVVLARPAPISDVASTALRIIPTVLSSRSSSSATRSIA